MAGKRTSHLKPLVRDAWRLSPDTFAQKASGGKWISYRHLRYVADVLRPAIINGNGRFIVEMPPRHGKSEFVSHWLPVWYFDLFPENRVILTGYGDALPKHFGRKIRNELEWNEALTTRLTPDKTAASDFEIPEGGGLVTAGIGGPITGRGGHLLIVDDPIKNFEEALSPKVRENHKLWFESTLYTRQEPGATIIVVMTRWHQDDLAGWLLAEHSDDWTEIRLPAIAEEDDPLGREEGEALLPERFPLERLAKIKPAVASWWEGMFQQRPTIRGGGILRKDAWRRYRVRPVFEYEFQSWDANVKPDGSSNAVGMAIGVRGAERYLLDIVKGKWGCKELIEKFLHFSADWPKSFTKLVENKANGPAVQSLLQGSVPGIVLVEPEGGKEVRALAAEPALSAGNWFIPDPMLKIPWVEEFLNECAAFPKGTNDDMVDAWSQAELYVRTRLGNSIGLGRPGEQTQTIVGDARRVQF